MKRERGWGSVMIWSCVMLLLFSSSTLFAQGEVRHGLEEMEVIFLVGLVDLTVEWQEVLNHIEPDQAGKFARELVVDGRVAYYLQGQVEGQYILNAQMDLQVDQIAQFFTGVKEQINPNEYYPIYGDTATLANGAKSKGNFYLYILEEDGEEFLWGNYSTDFFTSKLISWQRNLYGLKVKLLDQDRQLFVFFSQPNTQHVRDEIFSNGSSLFYLKYGQVLLGTDKLHVEIRESGSGEVLQSIPLVSGRDYQIDYQQGRVIFLREFSDVSPDTLTTPVSPREVQRVLIAEYDVAGTDLTIEQYHYGLRFTYQILKALHLGASVFSQDQNDGEPYQISGVDLGYQLADASDFQVEWAHSQAVTDLVSYSLDGGLTYGQLPADTALPGSHNAWNIELNLEGTDFHPALPYTFEGSYQFTGKGFSNLASQAMTDQYLTNLQITGPVQNQSTVTLDYLHDLKVTEIDRQLGSVWLTTNSDEQTGIAGGLSYQKIREPSKDAQVDWIGGVRVDHQYDEKTSTFLSHQFSLNPNLQTPSYRQTAVGIEVQPTDQVQINSQITVGERLYATQIGLDYQLHPASQLYGQFEISDQKGSVPLAGYLVGNRTALNSNWMVVVEEKQMWGSKQAFQNDLLSLQYHAKSNWMYGLDYTKTSTQSSDSKPDWSSLTIDNNSFSRYLFGEQELIGAPITDRETISAQMSHNGDDLVTNTQLKMNLLEKDSVRQYLFQSDLDWQTSPTFRVIWNLDFSVAIDQMTQLQQERYFKGELAGAYRPIWNDQFNCLGKYVRLENLAPADQQGGTVPDERANIVTVEGVYDLNPEWQLANKLGYKALEERLDRAQGEWVASDTYLVISRIAYKFQELWKFYGEYRILRNSLALDQKQGYLVGLERSMKDYSVGIGYNFTEFSDDLTTDVDQRRQGVFINMVRKW